MQKKQENAASENGRVAGNGASRRWQAILLDLDGTLVNSEGHVHARTLEALRAAHQAGVCVMVATGRSMIATKPVLDVLELPEPAAVFNGAGMYCPVEDRMLEERLLSQRLLGQAAEFMNATGDLAVWMGAHEKWARAPKDDLEVQAIAGLHKVQAVDSEKLVTMENVLRVTFLSNRHGDSHDLLDELKGFVPSPSYRTHFSLSLLPKFAGSPYQVADLHAPCLGKAEALRYLEETRGIPADKIVAVGDAYNDIEMVEAAGLGVCMENGVPGLKRRADRVIGNNEGAAIGELVEELFL